MNIQTYHNIYFIGIGGIGMSALARYFLAQGKKVSGYDKTKTDLTRALESEGVFITHEDKVETIPAGIDLIIYTAAIPKTHQQWSYLQKGTVPIIKRAEALGWISRQYKTIAVAGTHGKTTTSALISSILFQGKIPFTAFLGGISYDLQSNYAHTGDEWMVVEADEYDRSFLHLHPAVAILLSMDPDHLDIYGDHDSMMAGYWDFVKQINRGGFFLYRQDLENNFPKEWRKELSDRGIEWASFGLDQGDFRTNSIEVEGGKFIFNLETKEENLIHLVSGLPGRHNIENAMAACAACMHIGVSNENCSLALRQFKGIYRRFERLYEGDKWIYIDDYAHHPSEIEAAIAAARELFPGKNLVGIFQPHLYTRTQDFAVGFAAALDRLDEVILMEIYPAREEPIPGVNSMTIMQKMSSKKRYLKNTWPELESFLSNMQEGVLLTLGAGDIDLLRRPLIKFFKGK